MTTCRERARLLRVMAHPMRLEILEIVCRSDECVCHLSAALKKPQSYVSQQLAILRKEGLIIDRKEGNNVFYGLTNDRIAAQVAAILVATAEEEQVVEATGHTRVTGCNCPKCETDGACPPRA